MCPALSNLVHALPCPLICASPHPVHCRLIVRPKQVLCAPHPVQALCAPYSEHPLRKPCAPVMSSPSAFPTPSHPAYALPHPTLCLPCAPQADRAAELEDVVSRTNEERDALQVGWGGIGV